MITSLFLPLSPGLKITELCSDGAVLRVQVVATASETPCPLCGLLASRIHSRYRRTLTDLPCTGQRVILTLCVRKFFCDQPSCRRKIFTERFPEFVRPWARMTLRLCAAVQALGLATSGEAGTRLAQRLGIQTSPTTVLRRIMEVPDPVLLSAAVVGIDEWALRRGRRYGTILVDWGNHCIVDLLPDRDAESCAAWFKQHPGVKAVSRDRAGTYAEAARQGAPAAIHVADRFHILRNLGDMLERVVTRLSRQVATTLRGGPAAATVQGAADPPSLPPPPNDSRTRRLAQYEQVHALLAAGLSLRAIAKHLGLSRDKVTHFALAPTFPERRQGTRRPSILDPYLDYIERRWQEGCHNGTQIFRELQAQGFTHPRPIVAQYIARRRQRERAGLPPPPPPVTVPSSRQLRWYLLLPVERLTAEQQQIRERVLEGQPIIRLVTELVRSFASMARERQPDQLSAWLERLKQSQVPECVGVAIGIKRDLAAITAALSTQISNGPTEGYVNKLKVIKRQMYGRAGFLLLRQRVLHAV